MTIRFLLFIFFFQHLFSLNFEYQNNIPNVIIEGNSIDNGFLGGTNYPVIRWADWDNDSDSDLFLLDEDGHIRYYQNIGSNTSHKFIISDANLLDIANITWFYIGDFDNDNDNDIITQYEQNPSYLSYYINDNGIFNNLDIIQNEDNSYVISQQGSIPTFCDIDNDQDLDFFTVSLVGSVSFYENVGISEGKPIFNFITSDWEDILVTGENRHGANAINFIDMDNDNDFDLVWGDYYQSSIYVIWNEGDLNIPNMDNINISTSFPENNPISTVGRNMPSFTDIDADGDQDLFINVLGGTGGIQLIKNFYFYENIGSFEESNYTYITDDFLNSIDHISEASPTLIDIDSDGDLDLFIGQKFITESTPYNGRIYFYLNIGTSQNPIFSLYDNEFLGNDIGTDLYPHFGDIDSDGDYDLLIGTYLGNIKIYENIGDKFNFNFIFHSEIESDNNFWFSTPSLSDIDLDGDLDILVGNIYGSLRLYYQISPFEYQLQQDIFNDINVGYYSAPYFFDFDLDGDDDLIVGGQNRHRFYLNENNLFSESDIVEIPYLGKNVKFTGGNLYLSNQFDIISGISTGGIYILSDEICVLGDLNQDNLIDISDIIFLVNIVLDIYPKNNYLNCAGNLNNDLGFNIIDIINLSTIILGE